jgi:uncharacterized protein YkwD
MTPSVTATPTVRPYAGKMVVSTFTPVPASLAVSVEDIPVITATSASTPSIPETPDHIDPRGPLVRYTTHVVKTGDSLINIALQHKVPMAAIQLMNDMGDTQIVRVDQTLDIPRAEGWENASPYWVVYVVQAGDSISKIASRYDLAVAEVNDANSFTDLDLIRIGQAIVLPLDGPAKTAGVAQAEFSTPEPSTETPLPSTPQPTEVLIAAPTDGSSSPTNTPVPQMPNDFAGDTAAMRIEIFRLINEQRANHGLVPLAWNDILASAAQKHAEDCYARGWCGHTGSDGSTMKTRIIREGYDPVRWSECWAWYGTPAKAVEKWMDETPPNDPHRRTILSTYLTEVGVGVVPASGHGYYFIADFGTPRQ